MQRNWDIIRKILLKVEQLPTEDSTFASNELEGVDSEAVAYHMRLLLVAQANKGLLEAWTFIPTRDLKYLNKQREGVLVYGR